MNEQVNYAKIQRIQDDLEALTIGQFGTGFVTDAMLYESGIKATVASHTLQLADIVTLSANGTDDTNNIQSILDSGKILKLRPNTTYHISSINLNDNAEIITGGISTTIQQLPNQASGTRLIKVLGSNVTIGDITIIGNIATDSDEQNHGIFVQSSTNINNIKIGNIYGKNIRGDVVYIGGLTTAKVNNVQIGEVYIDNVLRNGVSITGGENIKVKSCISMGQCGYAVCDVEPNVSSQLCDKIYIGYTKGRQVMVAGQPSSPIGYVEFETLDLDPSFQSNSTPNYAQFTGIQYGGLTIRNYKVIHIDTIRTNNFDYRGINQPDVAGDYKADELVINRLEQSNCSLIDPSYNAYNTVWNTNKIIINGGNINIRLSSKYAFISCPDIKIKNVFSNGTLTYNIGTKLVFENIKIDSTYDCYVATGNGIAPIFINCTIAFTGTSVGRLCNQNKPTIINSVITCNNFIVVSGNIAIAIASTLNSVYYTNGIYNSTPATQGYTAPLQIGIYYLWVDTTGKLRIKNSSPTTDTDGTIVGTQS